MNTVRVRKIINYLNTMTRDELKKLLPKGIVRDKTILELPNVKYPTGILSILPKEESYSTLGRIAESMLGLPSDKINIDTLIETTESHYSDITDKDKIKIRKSVTTQFFIDRLIATRRQLEESFGADAASTQYEPTVNRGHVQGHPDMQTSTKVYEVKLTGQVKENWLEFLFQAFAYAALQPHIREINIVLPLQNLIWSYNVADGWPKREEYFNLLDRLSIEIQTVATDNSIAAETICNCHGIGKHISKSPGAFLNSIKHITDGTKAWQLFLSSNMSSRVTIKDEEIAPVAAHIAATGAKIFIHSPYIINLCAPEGEDDDYHTNCLINITRIAAAMNCSGVVVHVGKTTTRDPVVAMESQRKNLLRAAAVATPTCPILLETPAGQGTETLTEFKSFCDFVNNFGDLRIRACIDTCHVFACGHDPLKYLTNAITSYPGLVKLVHYNDSLVEQGAKKDRHAFMGMGHIGLEKMKKIAELCSSEGIPAVIEI